MREELELSKIVFNLKQFQSARNMRTFQEVFFKIWHEGRIKTEQDSIY